MRSLTATEVHTAKLAGLSLVKLAGRGAVDPETDAVFVAVDRVEDGVVEVDVIRIDSSKRTGRVSLRSDCSLKS